MPYDQAAGTPWTGAFHQCHKRGRTQECTELSRRQTYSAHCYCLQNYCDDGDFARVATIQDIADNNYSLSIPLYVKPEVNEEEIDTRSVQEHYDSWRAASEMMKLSYAKLNAMLGKEAEENE